MSTKHFCDVCGLEKPTSDLNEFRLTGGGEPPLIAGDDTCSVCWALLKPAIVKVAAPLLAQIGADSRAQQAPPPPPLPTDGGIAK